jgi:hypothetical protein
MKSMISIQSIFAASAILMAIGSHADEARLDVTRFDGRYQLKSLTGHQEFATWDCSIFGCKMRDIPLDSPSSSAHADCPNEIYVRGVADMDKLGKKIPVIFVSNKEAFDAAQKDGPSVYAGYTDSFSFDDVDSSYNSCDHESLTDCVFGHMMQGNDSVSSSSALDEVSGADASSNHKRSDSMTRTADGVSIERSFKTYFFYKDPLPLFESGDSDFVCEYQREQ